MDADDLYRDIVETSSDGIWVIDLQGRTIYANPTIAEIHRIAVEDLRDLTVFDTLDEEGGVQFAAHLADVAAGQINPGEVDVQWRRSDGTTVWMRASETPLLTDGRVYGLLHRFTDDTERRATLATLHASESALADEVAQNTLLRTVATAANEAATLADVLRQARSLVLLHDDWERARGFVPTDDGRVQPLYLDAEDAAEDEGNPFAETERDLAQRSFEEAGPVWDDRRLTLAFPIRRDGATYAVIVITSAPPLYRFDLIESMAERVAEQLATVVEREQAQAALARARDEAMEASRHKSEFLATMSHEIRTPLNGVIGLNDLLMRTQLTPDQQRLSSGVQVASRALLAVINDILDFSKIEAGHLSLETLDFEIRPLLDEVAAMLTETARAKGLDMVVSCHSDVPEALRGDPTRLAQVVTNLMSNAVKFTETGGVIVRATTRDHADRVLLQIEVSDTGIGVDDVEVASLFDPFHQADASTTRRYGGTGLGLAISREIATAMGGDITYAPNIGTGSVFTASVLLDRATAGSAVVVDDRARAVLGRRRALIVDDTEHNRLVLQEQLRWWDMAYDVAGSADEAAALLASALASGELYDVVLLDLAMPDRDGLELARQLRTDPGYDDVRFLLLTSVTNLDGHDTRAVEEILPKPVLASVLRDALIRLLDETPASPDQDDPTPAHLGRVLVVEDNPVNQMVACGFLAALGYDSITADNGRIALDLLERESVDAVLMDVQMPELDGYGATRALREKGSRLPIIAMTAAAIEGEQQRCLDAGMDDFLTKPVDPTKLAATLAHWLAPYAGLDVERLDMLRDIDPGNTSYLDRAIGNFLANARGSYAEMLEASAENDVARLRHLSHKFAGGALNLGATELGEAVRAVELITDGDTVEGTGPMLRALGPLLEDTERRLAAYRATY